MRSRTRVECNSRSPQPTLGFGPINSEASKSPRANLPFSGAGRAAPSGSAIYRATRKQLTVPEKARRLELQMTQYLVTKQGAHGDWGSNAEGEIQEMPLSKPDGEGWRLHSVLPTQYNVMAVWERDTPAKPPQAVKALKASPRAKRR